MWVPWVSRAPQLVSRMLAELVGCADFEALFRDHASTSVARYLSCEQSRPLSLCGHISLVIDGWAS